MRIWITAVSLLVLLALLTALVGSRRGPARPTSPAATAPVGSQYAGSATCRECHPAFHEKWASSHHGLAMQPYTESFARAALTETRGDLPIGAYRYRTDLAAPEGAVVEQGPQGPRRYPIAHALGGKNVYYFLTPLERGRLQVLPIAYDVRRREWFDTTASAVRHFAQHPDTPLHWRERPLTFNSSCFGCHVSQLRVNYNLTSDSYHTTWREPGIACETCHGPAEEHIRVCRAAQGGRAPADLRVLSTRRLTPPQVNDLCAPCHAKMSPLTGGGRPGESFFDHYDLAAFEDRDFHPDGRDLGENYTFTLWRASPCAASGRLDCLHCHTSSGRYRFGERDANDACLPCHETQVRQPSAHTRHAEGSAANRCVACHMPTTEFARMRRTDHSMRPPPPAASLAFGSPNACSLCHTNRDAAWADGWVRRWHTNDYQAPVLQHAGWIQAARQQRWDALPAILAYVSRSSREEVLTVSLLRLLANCPSNSVSLVLTQALGDRSPWVRASAAQALGARGSAEAVDPLLAATQDPCRLVRVRTAAALGSARVDDRPLRNRAFIEPAVLELECSLRTRPDDPWSHYNLGNFYYDRDQLKPAALAFSTALRLESELFPALVNGSMAYNRLGSNALAESFLRRALTLQPTNAAVNLNLGLLLGELGRLEEASACLRAALRADPQSDTAAFNLGVLLAKDRPAEALDCLRLAVRLRPNEPRFSYSLAFYLREQGQARQAAEALQTAVERGGGDAQVYDLLGEILESQNRWTEAAGVYQRAVADPRLPASTREEFKRRLGEPPR